MIELKFLGSLAVQGLPRARTQAVLSQTKGVALLAYLLLARDGGAVSRGEVMTLLWPDADRDRGALRNVLHGLRRQLGGDALRSSGDGMWVAETLVTSDATRFDRLLTEGRTPEALELFSGDLLPGFHVRGAPRFNTWLDEQRDRLRSRASRGAWRMAERAEQHGNWVTAADEARRAVRWSGSGEEGARRLIGLLHRAGDRVAALREYEGFAAVWERDFGLKPSPETLALVEAVRSGSDVHTPGTPRRRSAWTLGPSRRGTAPPPRIAVMPWVRVGEDPETDALATGLVDGIISTLSRVSGVRVVARESVDRVGTLQVEGAPHVSEKLGVDLILDGSLGAVPNGFTVAVRLIDASQDSPIWADVVEAGRSRLLPFQSELVLRVLEVLGVALTPEEEHHLARLPTTKAEAYELYLRGRRHLSRRSREGAEMAIELYHQSLALDPSFALALVGVADANLVMAVASGRRFPEARIRAREAAKQALDIDPRLGEAHATLGLVRGIFDLDWHGSETELLRAIALNPGYATAHQWYGGILSWVFERFDEGIEELELARQLDPLSPVIHSDIGMALLNQGRLQQAPGKFHDALAIDPSFWRGHYGLAVAAWLRGDREGCGEHFREAWRLGAWGTSPEHDPARSGGRWRVTLEGRLNDLGTTGRRSSMTGFEAALLATILERPDDALEWLGESEREGSIAFLLQYYPIFAHLADRPDFVALLERVGMRRTGEFPTPGG